MRRCPRCGRAHRVDLCFTYNVDYDFTNMPTYDMPYCLSGGLFDEARYMLPPGFVPVAALAAEPQLVLTNLTADGNWLLLLARLRPRRLRLLRGHHHDVHYHWRPAP